MNINLRELSDGLPSQGELSLRAVANRCNSAQCPTVYVSGTGTLVVQGYSVSAERAGVDLPAGESLVEIPLELVTEAVRNLTAPD